MKHLRKRRERTKHLSLALSRSELTELSRILGNDPPITRHLHNVELLVNWTVARLDNAAAKKLARANEMG
jgi:hypothetical protein